MCVQCVTTVLDFFQIGALCVKIKKYSPNQVQKYVKRKLKETNHLRPTPDEFQIGSNVKMNKRTKGG